MEIYTITSYDDFKKITNIIDILITDKLLVKGYIKFHNTGYLNLKCVNICSSYGGSDFKTLKQHLEFNKKNEHWFDENGKIVLETDINKKYIRDVQYDFNKIVDEIIEKYYTTELPVENNLDYDEFLVFDKNGDPKIAKLSDKTFKENTREKFGMGRPGIKLDWDMDLTYFNSIFKILLPLKTDREILKTFVKSVFIKKSDKIILFYDRNRGNFIIGEWLKEIVKKINMRNVVRNGCEVSHFFSLNKITIEDARIVFYDGAYPSTFHTLVGKTWEKINAKNYIINLTNCDSMYNINDFDKFMSDNKIEITKKFGVCFNSINSLNIYYSKSNHINLSVLNLFKNDYLFLNYLLIYCLT